MSPIELSVIIPSYNKRAVLAQTLEALETQTLPVDRFEVIVVDDGSTDGTREWLHEQAKPGAGFPRPYKLTVLSQGNAGPAVARNAGVEAAAGRLLLFIDADMVAAPGLLAAHSADHERHPHALILGRMMPWREALGGAIYRVFGQVYDLGDSERELPPQLGLTGNLSISAADFASLGGFDASLRWGEDTEFVYRASAGFDRHLPRGQDVEFTHRASTIGMVLHYCPEAVTFHNHALSHDELCSKARKDHRLLVLLFQRHPEIMNDLDYIQDKLPIVWGQDTARTVLRKSGRAVLATLPVRTALGGLCTMLEDHWPSPVLLDFLVWKLIGAYQWLGLRDGMREFGWRPHAKP